MSKYAHLKGNKHGCKEYPRDTSWGGARANSRVKSLAKNHATALSISLADYLERLVIADLKQSGLVVP